MALTKCGALWLKDGAKGKFLSGKVEVNGAEVSILVFKNDKGGVEKRPDYQVFLGDDAPRQERDAVKDEDFAPF